jgi:hypothetical protein
MAQDLKSMLKIQSISKILNPPYSVTIDGKDSQYQTVDGKIENVVEISINYPSGEHQLTIKGSPIASEDNTKNL